MLQSSETEGILQIRGCWLREDTELAQSPEFLSAAELRLTSGLIRPLSWQHRDIRGRGMLPGTFSNIISWDSHWKCLTPKRRSTTYLFGDRSACWILSTAQKCWEQCLLRYIELLLCGCSSVVLIQRKGSNSWCRSLTLTLTAQIPFL